MTCIAIDHQHYTALQLYEALLIKRVYAECNLLFQLLKLINILKDDPNDQILKKVKLKTHSYIGFGFNVTQIFLSQYNLTCTLTYCYSCGRL